MELGRVRYPGVSPYSGNKKGNKFLRQKSKTVDCRITSPTVPLLGPSLPSILAFAGTFWDIVGVRCIMLDYIYAHQTILGIGLLVRASRKT